MVLRWLFCGREVTAPHDQHLREELRRAGREAMVLYVLTATVACHDGFSGPSLFEIAALRLCHVMSLLVTATLRPAFRQGNMINV